MNAIENLTTQSHQIYITDFNVVRVLPGINLDISENAIAVIKSQPHLNKLFEKGLFVLRDFQADNQTVYSDENGLTFVDEGGEKVPVVQSSETGQSLSLVTGKHFTATELKALGFTNSLIAKIVSESPEAGWMSTKQIIDCFELSGKNADLVQTLII